jgi:hypothetical protein
VPLERVPGVPAVPRTPAKLGKRGCKVGTCFPDECPRCPSSLQFSVPTSRGKGGCNTRGDRGPSVLQLLFGAPAAGH